MRVHDNAERPSIVSGAGEPVFLRPLSANGAALLLAHADRRLTEWAPDYPAPGDLEAATFHLRRCEQGNDPAPFGLFEIGLNSDRTIIGGIGFHTAPNASGSAEIGYGVVGSAAGRGYATAALRSLLVVAADLGVQRVTGRAAASNTASCRVMTKVGMQVLGAADGLVTYAIALDGPCEGVPVSDD